MILKVKYLNPGMTLPVKYQSDCASGIDLRAAHHYPLYPGRVVKIATGVAVELPPGHEGQVRPRSGLALQGVTVANAPGTIDSDYRGEIGVLLINHGLGLVEICRGDRVAQLVVAPMVRAEIVTVDELSETERGAGGFGSTGVR